MSWWRHLLLKRKLEQAFAIFECIPFYTKPVEIDEFLIVKLDLSIKKDAYRKQQILQNIEIPREITASAIWSY